jgi:hypothetical protein
MTDNDDYVGKTYAEIHKGKMRPYQIMKGNGRIAREERMPDGTISFEHYTGPGGGGKSVIMFRPEDIGKYSYLDLRPALPASANTKKTDVHVPADWKTLTAKAKREIASQIAGKNIKETGEAEDIIISAIGSGAVKPGDESDGTDATDNE